MHHTYMHEYMHGINTHPQFMVFAETSTLGIFCGRNVRGLNVLGRNVRSRNVLHSFNGHSNIFHPISSKFHIRATIKLSPKFEYGFCLWNNNQDGHQNIRHLSVCTCRHSNLVIYFVIGSVNFTYGLLF